MSGKKFCGDCEHVSPTEEEQDRLKQRHVHHQCKLLGVQLFHFNDHPNINRDIDCPLEDEKK